MGAGLYHCVNYIAVGKVVVVLQAVGSMANFCGQVCGDVFLNTIKQKLMYLTATSGTAIVAGGLRYLY